MGKDKSMKSVGKEFTVIDLIEKTRGLEKRIFQLEQSVKEHDEQLEHLDDRTMPMQRIGIR